MRTIERTNQFKRDLKRELAGRYKTALTQDFIKIVEFWWKTNLCPINVLIML